MKIFISGGLGFIGSHLTPALLSQGHEVTAVGRTTRPNRITCDNFRYLVADTTRPGHWQDALDDADAVINLAGKSIFRRWTKKYKKQIYDSRLLTTQNIVSALPAGKSITLCSASGTGYYGSRPDGILDEDQPPGDDFLAGLSVEWENAALQAIDQGVRVITMRFGVVLARHGGALSKMIPAFKAFMGGPMGNGRQWFPWIHLQDLLAALMFVLEHPQISGPLNFCAPDPVTNRDLAACLGKTLKRPAVLPAPAFMLRLILGEFSQVLLGSQRTVPRKLLDHGFEFRYPQIDPALQDIVNG
jgi:uncharacterized protein (TIGR01777 family)